jgi:hypothetical protein
MIETDNENKKHSSNIYFIPERKKQKRLSGIPWHDLILYIMLAENGLFMFHLSSTSNDKEWANMKETSDNPTQKSRIWPLISGFALTMIDPARLVWNCWITNKSATSMQDLLHNTWLARYLRPQFIVSDNGNVG